MIYVVTLEDSEAYSEVCLVGAFKDCKKAETYAQKTLKEHLEENYEPDEYTLEDWDFGVEIKGRHHYVGVEVVGVNFLD